MWALYRKKELRERERQAKKREKKERQKDRKNDTDYFLIKKKG